MTAWQSEAGWIHIKPHNPGGQSPLCREGREVCIQLPGLTWVLSRASFAQTRKSLIIHGLRKRWREPLHLGGAWSSLLSYTVGCFFSSLSLWHRQVPDLVTRGRGCFWNSWGWCSRWLGRVSELRSRSVRSFLRQNPLPVGSRGENSHLLLTYGLHRGAKTGASFLGGLLF